MRVYRWLVLIPLVAAAAACGRNSAPAVDDALKSDLALASQAQGANAPISPNEAGFAPQTAKTAARQSTRSTSARSTSRRSSRVYRSSGSSGAYYPAPQPKTTIVKHTERDAAIGAAAGAVLGATSSRNKIRGGVIGAMVGGVLGGVIGNNVDIQKKTGW